jgi:hypothetical protein
MVVLFPEGVVKALPIVFGSILLAACEPSLADARLETLASGAAVGAAPTFRIAQIYSSLDGSTQFIRLNETDGLNGQHHFAGLALTSTHSGITKQFVFPSDLPTDQTAYLSILVAASPQGYVSGALPDAGNPGAWWPSNFSPDFVIPARFLATDGGSIDFAGVDRMSYASLPTDGANGLDRDLSVAPAIVAPSYCMPPTVGYMGPHRCGSFTIYPPAVSALEYYDASLDHFFYTASAPDIDALDSGRFAGWQRTGYMFVIRTSTTNFIGAPLGVQPVCRFYIPPELGDSHFFSASSEECEQVQQRFPAFVLEAAAAFYVWRPYDASASLCESPWDYAGLVPVYRLWNGRADSNHRYTTDKAVRDAMVARGYTAEGDGPDAIAFCSG